MSEAEVARGQFMLPEGFSLQVPTGRFTLPDGSIFLEGQGIPLTMRVPVDETYALSSEDEVSEGRRTSGARTTWGRSNSFRSSCFRGGAAGAKKAINDGAKQLEELAREQYGADVLSQARHIRLHHFP